MNELTQDVTNFLRDRIPDGIEIEPETDLLQSGLLDSLLIMDLIAHVQSVRGTKIPDSQVTPRNFETPAAIARLIESAELVSA